MKIDLINISNLFLKLANRLVSPPLGFIQTIRYFLNPEISMENIISWYNNNKKVFDELDSKGDRVTNLVWNEQDDDNGKQEHLESGDNSKDYYFRIQTYRELPDFIDPLAGYFLQGTQNIPNLFLYKVKYLRVPNEYNHDIGHNFFLYQYLVNNFGLTDGSEDTIDIVTIFLKENRDKINSIRRLFTMEPKFLGRGADGTAFQISNDFVLKLSLKEFGTNEAIKSMDRIFNASELAENEAMIYDAGTLGEFEGKNIYYYIIEKMRPIAGRNPILPKTTYRHFITIFKMIFQYADESREKLRDLKALISDNKNHKLVMNMIKNEAEHILSMVEFDYENIRDIRQIEYTRTGVDQTLPPFEEAIETIEKNAGLKGEWLLEFIDEVLTKYITSRTDLHVGNLGVTSYGKLRYFDPAFEGWKSIFPPNVF